MSLVRKDKGEPIHSGPDSKYILMSRQLKLRPVKASAFSEDMAVYMEDSKVVGLDISA
jgi:hypothetical protein